MRPACDRDPWLATSTNLDAVRLLNRLRSRRQLVIYPNTNSGYGAKTGNAFCTEETPLEPISLYGRDKVQAERELLDSPNAITFRLATVFGMSPRMRLDLLVNDFVHKAVTDGYLVIFEKDFKRNFIHVRDVADVFLHAMTNAEKMIGRCFNAGLDSANLSKAELAQKIKQHVPRFSVTYSESRQRPGQAQLHRLEPASARGGLRGEALAGRRHPRAAEGLRDDGASSPEEYLSPDILIYRFAN